jgi:hypothetical protein
MQELYLQEEQGTKWKNMWQSRSDTHNICRSTSINVGLCTGMGNTKLAQRFNADQYSWAHVLRFKKTTKVKKAEKY